MTDSELPENRAVGKYTILAALGEGGMAKVYLASAQGPAGFSKLVVVKVLRRRLLEDEDVRAMFLNEARLAARLNHANVVQTIEVTSDASMYFITMEYLEGPTLSAVLHRVSKERIEFPLALHLRVLVDVLAGLHYAHTLDDFDGTPLKIVHRDVSPHNVIVTYDGQVKLLDFGIAKAVGNTVHTETGVLRGKIAYMAPEQAFAARDIDGRADLYSVGVMLWQALAGQKLRKGKSDVMILQAAVSEDAPSPRTVNPNVDEGLARISLKALARNPADRYTSGLEMQKDLEAAMDRLGLRAQARDMGGRIAEMFKADRAHLRRIIDTQRTSPTRTLPVVTATEAGSKSGGTPVASSATAKPAPPKRWTAAIALLALAAMVAEFFLLRGKTDGGPAAKVSARESAAATANAAVVAVDFSSLPSAAPSAEQAAAPSFALTVRVLPVVSRISVDGLFTNTNPFVATFRSDGTAHRVRAEAPGYEAREEYVQVAHDTELALTLEPKRAARPTAESGGFFAKPAPPSPEPERLSPPRTAPTPNPDDPKIDTKDPYAN